MDEKEQELNLDDIMKEFSSQEGEPIPGDADLEDALLTEEEPSEQMPALELEPDAGETVRVELPPREAVDPRVEEPTQTFETPEAEDAEGEELEEAEEASREEEEIVSKEEWVSDGRQGADGYIPPEPIVFRPRSRLRELKRDLIAGPEKKYYDMSETGVGKLQFAMVLCLLVLLLSAGSTVMYAAGMVAQNRLRLMVFVQFFAMMTAALLGSYQLLDGILDLFSGRFSLNTLLVFTFMACCADGLMGLYELRVSCCAAFALEMLMAMWRTYHRRVTQMGQMDTLRKAIMLDGVCRSLDYYEGKCGLLRGEAQVSDFMDCYDETSRPERMLGIYGLIALLVSIAAGVAAGVLHSVSLGIQVLAVSLLAAAPASAFVVVSRPTALLEKRLHQLGSVICGWQGVLALKGKLIFPLRHSDLFPTGSCKMNGVKFYGDRQPDEVVEYATALMEAMGGGVAPLFTRLLESRNGRKYPLENLMVYENGGIGGEVNDEPVLAGNLSFMKEMGVEIPEGIRVDQAVYVAIDGELCGLFAITYGKSRSTAAGLSVLCSSRGLRPLLTTGDFMLTESFIRSKFGVRLRRMIFPQPEVRKELAAKKPEEGARMYALTTQAGLAPIAYAVAGARSLNTAANLGVAIHMIGGVVGLVMMGVLAVLGAGHLLTPVNLLLYELVWMIPGLLVTEWTRVI